MTVDTPLISLSSITHTYLEGGADYEEASSLIMRHGLTYLEADAHLYAARKQKEEANGTQDN